MAEAAGERDALGVDDVLSEVEGEPDKRGEGVSEALKPPAAGALGAKEAAKLALNREDASGAKEVTLGI